MNKFISFTKLHICVNSFLKIFIENFKEIYNKPSVLLIFLPYFFYYREDFIHSDLFNLNNFIFFIITFIVLDIIIQKYYLKFYYLKLLIYIFWAIYIMLVFGESITYLFQNISILAIRARNLKIAFFTFLVLFGIISKFKNTIVLNIFFTILMILCIFNNKTNNEQPNSLFFKKNELITNDYKEHKPVLLIILDEYSSPNELYKINKNDSVFNFQNKILNDGWLVIPTMYSYESSTIYSLSSMFNNNISKNKSFNSLSEDNVSTRFLRNSYLSDYMKSNEIDIINMGIFDLGTNAPYFRLYYNPESFLELMYMYTIVPKIQKNITIFKNVGLYSNDKMPELHNEWVFKNVIDSLYKIKNNHFVYAHLYMPHYPLSYKNEFKTNEIGQTEQYIDYWNFTNEKIYPIIKILSKKYRIILTGDHGYRQDKLINKNITFSAFWGFKTKDINELNSVQDILKIIY